MDNQHLVERFRALKAYVGWTEADEKRLRAVGLWIQSYLPPLVEDFYQEILRDPITTDVIKRNKTDIAPLRLTLLRWLEELFTGPYDDHYAAKHWKVGVRHVEIGLPQVYTNAAVSRIRQGLIRVVIREGALRPEELAETLVSVNRILDLDLAIIEDSYSDRRRENETLAERRRGERKFRNLVEAAACMIVIMRLDGEISYLSPFAERLAGWSREQAAGRPFVERYVNELPDESDRRAWAEVLTTHEGQDCELPIRCRDGSERWLIWNVRTLEDFDGQPAILAVGHDITEKRIADLRLLQAERLAAIGSTITGLAHESRNALQRINSCTEMLEFEVEDRPEAMQLIQRSQQAQDDLTRLFDEVRNFAAPIGLERVRCKVSSVWCEAWELLNKERQACHAELVEEIEEPEPILNIDRFRMIQVFRNLFENSLAACPDPGLITIRSRSVSLYQLPPALIDSSVRLESNGSLGGLAGRPSESSPARVLEIRFQDNGPGLSPKAKVEVFEPFFTTKSKGTGLGMSIARRVLNAHGGSIAVGDSARLGAEFVLYLPRE